MSERLTKGYATEEILRNYFNGMGFYVARGVKYKYHNFDVTDIDLLLYGKSSPLNRERINVDIKNKKTPQAIERIFWAKGLQQILKLDDCIVVTSENRSDVMDFGLKHNIRVLDGKFLDRLSKSNKSASERLTEEAFSKLVEEASNGKIGGDWKGKLEVAKSRLLEHLSFDGCNAYLNDIKYFLHCVSELQDKSKEAAALWRAIYATTSYFLLSLDYLLKDHQTSDQEQRKRFLDSGFRYGTSGKAFTERMGSMASALAGSVMPNMGVSQEIERELKRLSESVRSEILSEHFSKANVNNALFECAREYEFFAYEKEVFPPSNLSSLSQAALAILCDFNELDRKKIIF